MDIVYHNLFIGLLIVFPLQITFMEPASDNNCPLEICDDIHRMNLISIKIQFIVVNALL